MDNRIRQIHLITGGMELRITPADAIDMGPDMLTAELGTMFSPGDLGHGFSKGGLWRIPVLRRNE